MHGNTTLLYGFGATLVIGALFAATARDAVADSRGVAVLPFEGPHELARSAQQTVTGIVTDSYELIAQDDAETLVRGRIVTRDGRTLLGVSVRDARSGKSSGAILVPLTSTSVDEDTRDLVAEMLAPLLETEGHQQRSPVELELAVGVSATVRRLDFAHDSQLAQAQRPEASTGTAHAAVGASGALFVRRIGLGVEASIERSASGYPEAQGRWGVGLVRKLPVLGGSLRARAGYNEVSHVYTVRPANQDLRDAHYGFVDIGGGARVPIRAASVFLLADVRYLHVTSTAGLTAADAFGAARARGVEADGAIELRTSRTTYLRVGSHYLRIALAFDGTGALATQRDGDPDIDVAGATDVYLGGYALFGFQF